MIPLFGTIMTSQATIKRPSVRELTRKLKDAKAALRTNTGFFANVRGAGGELNDLQMVDSDDVWPLILILLKEIEPEDFVGQRPPEKSYEAKIYGLELFAFAWESERLGKRMYLKFALQEGRFYYFSLHPSKERGE